MKLQLRPLNCFTKRLACVTVFLIKCHEQKLAHVNQVLGKTFLNGKIELGSFVRKPDGILMQLKYFIAKQEES